MMKLIFIIIFLLSIYACSSGTPISGLTATSPTENVQTTDIQVTDTPTSELAITPLLIRTLTATSTQTPTVSANLTPTKTSTSIPTSTKTPHENPGLIVTLGEIVTHQGWYPAIPAFSPDGKQIAVASNKVTLWDISSYELVHELIQPHNTHCHTDNVSFSKDSKYLAVSVYCWDIPDFGNLLLWETANGNLLYDWRQEFSKDTLNLEDVNNRFPATGFAFLPDDSHIAIANGNTIEIRDIRQNKVLRVFELGDDMIASDITVSDDEIMYVFMDFNYYNFRGNPSQIVQKYAVQIWDLKTNSIQRRIDFPEITSCCKFVGQADVEMRLMGTNLTRIDYINGTYEVTNLKTGETKKLPYREGVAYLSSDTKYIVYFPFNIGLNCQSRILELWDTNDSQKIYTFKTNKPGFSSQWCYGPHTIAFNPSNTMLAITHEERLTLWDISNLTKVDLTP